ncbi:metallothionein 2A [Actinidia rufa]|uniref:Metallothionein-like protein n=1 Tax=Actinidia rufa TaxID=165716 RepID=A0A7J0F3J9_9ERIC|nr:metallothionein 2A [Actinidia rufa]
MSCCGGSCFAALAATASATTAMEDTRCQMYPDKSHSEKTTTETLGVAPQKTLLESSNKGLESTAESSSGATDSKGRESSTPSGEISASSSVPPNGPVEAEVVNCFPSHHLLCYDQPQLGSCIPLDPMLQNSELPCVKGYGNLKHCPESILKNAAKSFTNAPSTLRKRKTEVSTVLSNKVWKDYGEAFEDRFNTSYDQEQTPNNSGQLTEPMYKWHGRDGKAFEDRFSTSDQQEQTTNNSGLQDGSLCRTASLSSGNDADTGQQPLKVYDWRGRDEKAFEDTSNAPDEPEQTTKNYGFQDGSLGYGFGFERKLFCNQR